MDRKNSSHSIIKSTWVSSREPKFAFQHLQDLCLSFPGDLMPSSGICGHCSHVHKPRGKNIYIVLIYNKNKIFKKKTQHCLLWAKYIKTAEGQQSSRNVFSLVFPSLGSTTGKQARKLIPSAITTSLIWITVLGMCHLEISGRKVESN